MPINILNGFIVGLDNERVHHTSTTGGGKFMTGWMTKGPDGKRYTARAMGLQRCGRGVEGEEWTA